jgi:3-oxoacyl-[acyl-carrier protein] reductase
MSELALVTGGSRGIGAAIAERLTSDGMGVIVVDRAEPEHDHLVEFVRLDLSDAAATAAELGRLCRGRTITRLVNNAGIVAPAAIEEVDVDSVERVMAVNIKAAIVCVQALLPGMKQAGTGRIVNISSRTALGKELRTVYAASKAGLHGMTKTWALELGRHGITVNAIGPGPIRTALFEAVNPPDAERTKEIIARIPVGFVGEPKDIADAVSFFASERARFVTGQVLYVCGGMTVGSA